LLFAIKIQEIRAKTCKVCCQHILPSFLKGQRCVKAQRRSTELLLENGVVSAEDSGGNVAFEHPFGDKIQQNSRLPSSFLRCFKTSPTPPPLLHALRVPLLPNKRAIPQARQKLPRPVSQLSSHRPEATAPDSFPLSLQHLHVFDVLLLWLRAFRSS